mmetsp:Transcript_93547/g.264119  ORF Transcript_93547/g.264119 Transcript_93547/m.264119 type:complete len:220 (-) Transcript_93547:359-1018(-)
MQPCLQALVRALKVGVAQVDRVVDRKANHNDTRDAFTWAEVPSCHLAVPEHVPDDETHRYNGRSSEDDVGGPDQYDDKGDREADGESRIQPLDEALVRLHPFPIERNHLQDGLHGSGCPVLFRLDERHELAQDRFLDRIALPETQAHHGQYLDVFEITVNEADGLRPIGSPRNRGRRCRLPPELLQAVQELLPLVICAAVPNVKILNEARDRVRAQLKK